MVTSVVCCLVGTLDKTVVNQQPSIKLDNYLNLFEQKISAESLEVKIIMDEIEPMQIITEKEIPVPMKVSATEEVTYDCLSTLRKRRRKMRRHKYRKMLKEQRFIRRQLNK